MDIDDLSAFLRQFWGLWLMIFFIAIVGWAFWPSNRGRLESHANIPLDDDKPGPRGQANGG